MEKLTEPVSIKQTQSLPGTGISQCIFSPRFFWHLIWRGRQQKRTLDLLSEEPPLTLWNHGQVTSFLWTLLSSVSGRDSFSTCTLSREWSEEMALFRVTWNVNKWSPQGQYLCCHSSAGPSGTSLSLLVLLLMPQSPFPSLPNISELSLPLFPHQQPFTSLQHIPGSEFSLAWMTTLLRPLLLLKFHTQSKNACSMLSVAFRSSGLSSVVLWCRLPSDETIVFMVLHHLYRNCVLSPLLACFLICKAKNTYLTDWL